MPTTGPDLFREIVATAERAKGDLESQRRQQSAATAFIEALAAERGEAFVELSQHYLPDLSHESVRNTWGEIRKQIQDVLLRKQDRQLTLTRLQEDLEAARTAAQRSLDAVNNELDAHAAQRDRLSKQLSEQLSDDPKFQDLTNQAAVAEINLERAEASMAEVEQDVIEKLPDYENSRLFQYLYQRGMGTPQYTARGMRRRLDHWVGKMIDYPKARKSFEFLTEVPDKMRELIAERRDVLNRLMERLEAIQASVSSSLGLDVVLDSIERSEQTRETSLLELERIDGEIGDAIEELGALADSVGPFYKEAIDRFHNLLNQTETFTLEARAARTPESEDDQLIARIKHLEEQIAEAHRDADNRRADLNRAEDSLEAISYLAQRFQRARFDDARSYFDDGLDIKDSLERLCDGREDADLLWNQIRRHQHTAPTWYEENSRRIGSAAGSPMGQILLQTMAHTAGAAMRDYARRAGQRRASVPQKEKRSAARKTPKPKRRAGFANRRSF